MSAPFFSIFIALRNAAAFVDLSLYALLRQTNTSWEAIVIDDASEDDSYDVIRKAAGLDERIRVIRNAQRVGKVANFLTALPLLRGTVFVEYDGDDWFSTPRALDVIAAAYDAPEVDATTGRAICLTSNMEPSILAYPRCHRYSLTTVTPVSPRTTRLSLVRDFVSAHPDLFIDPVTARPWSAWGDVVLSAPSMLLARRIQVIPEIIYTINDGHAGRDCRTSPDFDRLARDTFAACIALERELQGDIDWENHAV